MESGINWHGASQAYLTILRMRMKHPMSSVTAKLNRLDSRHGDANWLKYYDQKVPIAMKIESTGCLSVSVCGSDDRTKYSAVALNDFENNADQWASRIWAEQDYLELSSNKDQQSSRQGGLNIQGQQSMCAVLEGQACELLNDVLWALHQDFKALCSSNANASNSTQQSDPSCNSCLTAL